MSIAAFYILDKKGNIIINRHYTADLDQGIIERFQASLVCKTDIDPSPFSIDTDNSMVFTHLTHKDIIRRVISPCRFNT